MLYLMFWVLPARAEALEPVPVFLHSAASVVVPGNVNGQLNALRFGFSVPTAPLVNVGLRGEVALPPGLDGINGDGALLWAAAAECRSRLGLSTQADPFVIIAGGFVTSDRVDGANLVLPYGQIGVGMRILLSRSSARNLIYFEPEIAVVPGFMYDLGPLSVAAPVASGVVTVAFGDSH